MNSISITGYVGQEPRKISLQDPDKTLVTFSVGDKQYSKAAGEFTMWVDVQVWGARAETALKAITKGREVTIVGKLLMSRQFTDKNGVTRTNPVIRLESFHLCGSKPDASKASPSAGDTASADDATSTDSDDEFRDSSDELTAA